jgi:acyl-CoA thioesterase I
MERVKTLLQATQPVKWIFEGDSITHGALHTFGWRDYTELFTERIRFELSRTRDVIIKTAAGGHTTNALLGDFDWRVKQFQPNVVFLMFGMNDCSNDRKISPDRFRGNLISLCKQVTALSAVPVLQTTTPVIPGTAPEREPTFDAYMDIIRQVAASENVPLIDHTSYWRKMISERYGVHFYWTSNGFHPNQFGHLVLAEYLFKELGIFDEKSFSCRLYHP